jgi:site-specific DNA-adenine methylase
MGIENLNYIVYPGNKTNFLPDILPLIESVSTSSSILLEPFGGSGTVSLHASLDDIVLNEKDYYIFKIHESFKHGLYLELKEIIDEIWSFGNPKENKEDYYKARTELNQKYFKSNNKYKEGFYYWAISTFAINSMVRFGPNGFNQGWGHRGIGRISPTESFSKKRFDEIQKKNTKK